MEKGLQNDFFYFSYNYPYLNSNEKIQSLIFQKNTTSHYQKDIINLGRPLHIIKWYLRITFLK